MKYCAFAFLLLLVTSCAPTIYTVVQPNTPLPREKGDFEIAHGLTLVGQGGSNYLASGITTSYAFSNKYFASGAGLVYGGGNTRKTVATGNGLGFADWAASAGVWELGLGRYWTDSATNQVRGEVTAGFGMGYHENQNNNLDFTETNYTYIITCNRLAG